MLISCFPTTETDSLEIKLKQFKTVQQAAHDLMQQEHRQQAVATYLAVSERILEIELELIARQQPLSIYDECDHEQN
ncbi:MAG: hypothetical protein H0X30_00030 [Anaerolineae bacterium]|nr:hypothetical protein [Anaerolineae bacterium]